ncbi:MAG: hypothetical protein H0X33_13320 [Taibaiella sp.]|nr:hypothetical protein [Taibaiella sp.]
MSHCFVLVLLEQEQAKEENSVDNLLAPYNENLKVAPYKTYFDVEDVTSGIKQYGSEETLIANIEDWWGEGPGGKDENGIYYMRTRNPDAKWDWYQVGGRYDGAIPNNICLVRELPENVKCYAIVTPNGKWHERGKLGWFGMISEPNDTWDHDMLMLLGKHTDCVAVGIDIHI